MERLSIVALVALCACGKNAGADGTDTTPGPGIVPTQDGTGDQTGAPVADAVGNDIASATDITVGHEYYVPVPTLVAEETIFPAGDRDFYVVDGADGTVWQFYTSSYHLEDEVVLDTVLRFYDGDGNMLVENDDMPYRFWETDSGLFVQQTWTGPLYIEVLEWSDWEGLDPLGGPDYAYELYGAVVDGLEAVANDSIAEAIQSYDDVVNGGTGYYQPFWQSTYADGLAIEMFGRVQGYDTDDYWAFKTDAESEGNYWQWGMWPQSSGDADFEMTLYDASGNVLGSTHGAETEVEPEFNFVYNTGITYRVHADTTYVVGVRNLNPASNTYAYEMLNTGYTADLSEPEGEPNNTKNQAYGMIMEESTVVPGTYFGRLSGDLPSTDAADYILIDNDQTGSVNGKYLSVYVNGLAQGSFLDARFTVEGAISGTLVSATNSVANGEDPEVEDFKLTADEDLTIGIEADMNTAIPGQNSWFVLVILSDEPSTN